MIIAKGKQYDSKLQDWLLDSLEEELNDTLTYKTLPMETVIAAIDTLGKKVAAGEFDDRLSILPREEAARYKGLAATLLTRENMAFKVRTELGADFCPAYLTDPPAGLSKIAVKAMPLGVVLHIAAGNADGLPAFSLAEGLLTGNINILKLPSADNGLSVAIIQALIDIEPALADFIYVFDTPSTDVSAIKRMANLSDAIVVWGGDAAINAVRKFAAPGTKLIEWGHKLSFTYISGYTDKERELVGLAEHIITTKQLLCSSCQVIYLDTEHMNDVSAFCDEFLPILERVALAHQPDTLGGAAELTLRQYTHRLETILQKGANAPEQPYQGLLCGLTPKEDSELELSEMFGNCLVKRLPQKDIIPVLRRKKGYLQTAGLICSPERRLRLAELLERSGVVRVIGPEHMSAYFAGEAHDGEYPLRRYLRIVNEEIFS